MKLEVHEISQGSLEKEQLGIKLMIKDKLTHVCRRKCFIAASCHLQKGMVTNQKPKYKDQTVK